MRIMFQEFFKGRPRLVGSVQVVLINFSDREERVATVLAARIFLAKKPVLVDGFVKDLVVFEAATHLDERFGDRDRAGICLCGSRRSVVNVPVGVEDALVIAPRTL